MEEQTTMQNMAENEMANMQNSETLQHENNVCANESTNEPTNDASQETAVMMEEPTVDYSNMDRKELVEAMKVLLEEDVANIKNRVSQLRTRFNELTDQMHNEALKKFLDEGGNKEDFKMEDDQTGRTFYKLYGTYRERRQQHLEHLEAEKMKNLEAKKAILEELRTLLNSEEESIKQLYENFNALQEKWKSVGEIPRDQNNDIWQNYHFLIEQFFNKVHMSQELHQLDLKRNLEGKLQLCEKAEELLLEPSITKAFKALQDLRQQWKSIGPVPKEQNEEIWQRFNAAANKIHEQRQNMYDQRMEELEKNLLAKQALVEKVKEMVEVQPQGIKEWNDRTATLDDMLKVWRTIGPVPREQNETIWNTFKAMIDAQYAQKKEYFNQIRDEQGENYNKKLELCLKAEAIAKREDWKTATDELLALQKEWKAIGMVSRKVSDKVWQRFRAACDEFFAHKAEHYNSIHGAEEENLKVKEGILAELKAYQFGTDKAENLNVIKDFQRRWSEAGFVPMREKDRLQKEFRSVIDGYFEQLRISAREAEEADFRERLRNVGDPKKFISSEKDSLMEKIEKLRGDLKLWENNLGFLSQSRQADLLKEEFEKKMQNARQQIALMEQKLRILKAEEEKN